MRYASLSLRRAALAFISAIAYASAQLVLPQLRATSALFLVCVGFGAAVVSWFELPSEGSFSIGLALGLGVLVLVSTAGVASGLWAPAHSLHFMCALTGASAVVRIHRDQPDVLRGLPNGH